MRRAAIALLCLLALVAACAALAGCGSSSSSSGSEATTAPLPPTAPGGSGEREAPPNASPLLRALYRQFPPPKPDPGVKKSGPTLRAGERACAGKTPLEVKRAFYAKARKRGGLSTEEAKAIRELPHFERFSDRDSSFTAGQLAADVYAATLPKALATYGYRGCVHVLAKRLERHLAPRKGRG